MAKPNLTVQLEQSHIAYQNLQAQHLFTQEQLARASLELLDLREQLARARDRTRYEVTAANAKLKAARAARAKPSAIDYDARRHAAVALAKVLGRGATGAEVRAYLAERLPA